MVAASKVHRRRPSQPSEAGNSESQDSSDGGSERAKAPGPLSFGEQLVLETYLRCRQRPYDRKRQEELAVPRQCSQGIDTAKKGDHEQALPDVPKIPKDKADDLCLRLSQPKRLDTSKVNSGEALVKEYKEKLRKKRAAVDAPAMVQRLSAPRPPPVRELTSGERIMIEHSKPTPLGRSLDVARLEEMSRPVIRGASVGSWRVRKDFVRPDQHPFERLDRAGQTGQGDRVDRVDRAGTTRYQGIPRTPREFATSKFRRMGLGMHFASGRTSISSLSDNEDMPMSLRVAMGYLDLPEDHPLPPQVQWPMQDTFQPLASADRASAYSGTPEEPSNHANHHFIEFDHSAGDTFSLPADPPTEPEVIPTLYFSRSGGQKQPVQTNGGEPPIIDYEHTPGGIYMGSLDCGLTPHLDSEHNHGCSFIPRNQDSDAAASIPPYASANNFMYEHAFAEGNAEGDNLGYDLRFFAPGAGAGDLPPNGGGNLPPMDGDFGLPPFEMPPVDPAAGLPDIMASPRRGGLVQDFGGVLDGLGGGGSRSGIDRMS